MQPFAVLNYLPLTARCVITPVGLTDDELGQPPPDLAAAKIEDSPFFFSPCADGGGMKNLHRETCEGIEGCQWWRSDIMYDPQPVRRASMVDQAMAASAKTMANDPLVMRGTMKKLLAGLFAGEQAAEEVQADADATRAAATSDLEIGRATVSWKKPRSVLGESRASKNFSAKAEQTVFPRKLTQFLQTGKTVLLSTTSRPQRSTNFLRMPWKKRQAEDTVEQAMHPEDGSRPSAEVEDAASRAADATDEPEGPDAADVQAGVKVRARRARRCGRWGESRVADATDEPDAADVQAGVKVRAYDPGR